MTTSESSTLRVLKLGGSLLDLPDLPVQFKKYRELLTSFGPQRLLLVVGGGAAADVVREHNRLHDLGEHDGHWLAVRAMSFNAHCVARILNGSESHDADDTWPGCEVVASLEACTAVWADGKVAVVEPVAWLELMEQQGRQLPRRWSFTSDSIAAAIALQTQADVLTLLKSTLPTKPLDTNAAALAGLVDDDFPMASRGVAQIELVNLRAAQPQVQQMPGSYARTNTPTAVPNSDRSDGSSDFTL